MSAIKNALGKVQLAAATVLFRYRLVKVFRPVIERTYVFGRIDNGEDYSFMLNSLKNATVLEAGARTGASIVLLAQKVGSSGKVIAIEPNPYAFNILAQVTRHLVNVITINAALSDQKGVGTMVINKPFDSGAHIEVASSVNNAHLRVKIETLDSLLLCLNVAKLDALILDCEGEEFNVLKGSVASLEKKRIINLIIELHSRNSVEKIPLFLNKLGYNCRIFHVKNDYPLLFASIAQSCESDFCF